MRIFVSFAIIAALSACSSNPLSKLTLLSDLAVEEDAVAVALSEAIGNDADDVVTDAIVEEEVAAITAEKPVSNPIVGFFDNLFAGDETPKVVTEAVVEEDTPAPDTPTPDVVGVTADLLAEAPTPAPQRAGFFGRLFGGGGPKVVAEPDPKPEAVDVAAPKQAGFLSGFMSDAPAGPDARTVSVGTQLPFGEIAKNCDVSNRQMGRKVGTEGGYSLFDTIPNAESMRTHYITGFKDRCARQFTAATSLLGDIGTHEVVRYLPSNKRMAYSDTDLAYEKIKNAFCRVGKGQPCGAKLDRLARSTTFITAYRNFGTNPTWVNILLHKGQVIEISESKR